jgi:hypothetical protein
MMRLTAAAVIAAASGVAMPAAAAQVLPFSPGEDLCMPVQSRPQEQPARPPGKLLNTLQELWDAIETCWEPPPLDKSRPGTEITIRFSLTRSGEILGEPRFTYSTPSLPTEVKAAYQQAIAATLSRCAPFHLSDALGGAIAGRPISTRFIDPRRPRRMEKNT